MTIDEFAERLSSLRQRKGISARDMSLSIGLNENYISNIERKNSFPSMTVFFYICDFFDITPAMFFDMDSKNPIKLQKIFEKMKSLNDKQLENLDFIVDEMKK